MLRYAIVRPRSDHLFHIVSAQRNMGETALRCLQSVYDQQYPRESTHHLFIDDASTDDTPSLVEDWLRRHPDNCVSFVHNRERRGMLANNLEGFTTAPAHAIGIELNGDDWLPDPGVLRFLNKVYSDDDVWMTYNTLRQTDGTILFQIPPPRAVRRERRYRQWAWSTSHLRTFRAPLYRRIPEHHFEDSSTGTYWDTAQDMAVYLAMLELAGEHARHLYRITCTYNPHEMSDHFRDRYNQLAADERIRALPPCQALTTLGREPSASAEVRIPGS
jgi:glycosyltransferase involved in cell wall biosynthesis